MLNLALLLSLGAVSALALRPVLGGAVPSVSAGAAVMAWGIFVVAALTQLPFPAWVGQLVTLELLVVWGYLAFSYLRSGFRGELGPYLRRPANALAAGTWVAGSAVLGRALVETLPQWRALELGLWTVAVVVWIFYLRLLPGAFRAAGGSGEYRANGALLLPCVATQSLVVSGDAALPGGMPELIAAVLIGLGCLFYASGFVLITGRYLLIPDWSLPEDWDDTNCILHGAVSIAGLAAVQSGALPYDWAFVLWLWAVAAFVVVEGLELARAAARVRVYGWREGLLPYNVSQWSRNFTFGMLYAFTLQLGASPATDDWASGAQGIILDFGQYVVLAALLVETALFFYRKAAK